MFFRSSLKKVLAGPSPEAVFRDLYERIDRKRPLSLAQQGVVDTWWLFAEVANGTFEQYIRNSAGDHFDRVEAFFKHVGLTSALEILFSVRDAFPSQQVPSERSVRVEAFEAWFEKIGRQDAEKHIRCASTALIGLRLDAASAIVAFIKAHEEEYERA